MSNNICEKFTSSSNLIVGEIILMNRSVNEIISDLRKTN